MYLSCQLKTATATSTEIFNANQREREERRITESERGRQFIRRTQVEVDVDADVEVEKLLKCLQVTLWTLSEATDNSLYCCLESSCLWTTSIVCLPQISLTYWLAKPASNFQHPTFVCQLRSRSWSLTFLLLLLLLLLLLQLLLLAFCFALIALCTRISGEAASRATHIKCHSVAANWHRTQPPDFAIQEPNIQQKLQLHLQLQL